jgi:hypothetical protein
MAKVSSLAELGIAASPRRAGGESQVRDHPVALQTVICGKLQVNCRIFRLGDIKVAALTHLVARVGCSNTQLG